MRAYKLPDGEWIDLDHVQAIGPIWRNCGDYWVYQLCELTLAFQEKTKKVTLASFSDYGKWGDERNKLEDNCLEIAKNNYEELLLAWKTK